MKPICECCWSQIVGDVFEMDDTTMCEQCYDYNGGFEMIEMREQILSTDNYDWTGWYRMDNGNFIKCDEFIGSTTWEKEWEGFNPLPDGAVYYEIYDESKQEIDEGVMAYMNGDTFSDFMDFVFDCGQGLIESKIPDEEVERMDLE